jgi:hypothetical protein
MSAEFRNEISINGYKLIVLKSALQKYIRRSNVYNALYCAGELDLFSKIEKGEKVRTNFFNRLVVILLEDVCNISLIEELFPLFVEIKKDRNNIEDKLNLIVTKMCLSQKARICSHLKSVFNIHNVDLLKCNGIEFDIHVRDEMTLNAAFNLFEHHLRGRDIICVKYALFINYSEEKMEKAYKRTKNPAFCIFQILSKYINCEMYEFFYKNYIGQLKERFLCWMVPLLKYLHVIPDGCLIKNNYERINEKWHINLAREKITIDDFVFDMHTGNRNSGALDFVTEGAKVENEVQWIRKDWKNVYEHSKRPRIVIMPAHQQEKKFKFVIRTQLTTSKHKQDVYFAMYNEQLKVIKGPFSNKTPIKNLFKITQIKKENGIAYVPFTIEELYPNQWDQVPLGIRNSLDKNQMYYFIIFESVISPAELVSKIHKSKLWPDTVVVDWEKVHLHLDFKRKLSDDEMAQYIDLLLFRYAFKLSDITDRNFLRKDGKITSIDENIAAKPVNLFQELKKTRCKIITDWLEENENIKRLKYKSWELPAPAILIPENIKELFESQN